MKGTPYIPNTLSDREQMLAAIGVKTVDDLFQDIPAEFLDGRVRLPQPLSELELTQELAQLSRRNADLMEHACFLGGGYYRHYIPAVIGHITGRSELYTAYTPYQPELSQGTLQALHDYQSLVCELTGMEVSNAGMYDGSSAAGEAALMACRVTARSTVSVLPTLNPRYRQVISTYTGAHGVRVVEAATDSLVPPRDCACLIVQYPDFLGRVEDLSRYAEMAHRCSAFLVVIANPIALGMFKSPGDYSADIVVGEGQPLGTPPGFGGPGLGFFAARKEHVRQMPGRIIGKTHDVDGKPGYVLTLAAREQHIRREDATSNICTSGALVALAAAVYLAALGKKGLRHVASLCYHKAHYAAARIGRLKGYSLVDSGTFFNEFVVRCPGPPAEINRRLLDRKIIGGLDVSDFVRNGMLLCVTEANPRLEIDRLVDALGSL